MWHQEHDLQTDINIKEHICKQVSRSGKLVSEVFVCLFVCLFVGLFVCLFGPSRDSFVVALGTD